MRQCQLTPSLLTPIFNHRSKGDGIITHPVLLHRDKKLAPVQGLEQGLAIQQVLLNMYDRVVAQRDRYLPSTTLGQIQ